jgi:hypothetical protein
MPSKERIEQQAPILFECMVDRSDTEMPDDYLPTARGILIAGRDMLRAAGYVPGSCRPRGWSRRNPGVFARPSAESQHILWVRQCGRFWVIERSFEFSEHGCDFRDDYALTCALTDMPISTRTYQAAMRLAEHCDMSPRPARSGSG